MVIFTKGQWRAFNRIRRRYKVSLEFLKYNMPNILKFIAYYTKRLHFVLKCRAERSKRHGTVVIKYNTLKRSLFDEEYSKKTKRHKQNTKQWSKRMVLYLRKTQGVKEFIIIKKISVSPQKQLQSEEVTKQVKEQLELLKSGKRSTQLIDTSFSSNEFEMKIPNCSKEVTNTITEVPTNKENDFRQGEELGELILNEKTGVLESCVAVNLSECNSRESNDDPKVIESTPEVQNAKNNANILDLLMSKVCATSVAEVKNVTAEPVLNRNDHDIGVDSGEEFLGFAEDDNIPGMMRTPLVPPVRRSKKENSAFISESLDEYFRENSLNRSSEVGQLAVLLPSRKLRQASIDGLMTINCTPPDFSMPAVPESLQKLRTVAERRNYLQRFSKNIKMAIINNEAAIYRELKRKIKQPKIKLTSQQAMQANGSQMSFTRQGWQAASFVTTDVNKYFFQKIFFVDENESATLPGVRGNNTDQYKQPYSCKVSTINTNKCTTTCIDCHIFKCLRPICTPTNKRKICKESCQSIFKPCPLSKKSRQPLPDDDAAEILLIGGGMSVVCLPSVELQVCPELGKPFNDIAKRYLEHILPYEGITREWAEFSTSTLQAPLSRFKGSKSVRKTFSFPVPYANDRQNILVRRAVDRSEKLDQYFLHNSEEPNWSGLSFCKKIDKNDRIEVECASLLADMINSVAISCSENSFAKEDSTFVEVECKNTKISPGKLKTETKTPASQKQNLSSKKSRLISELRRLNATIIETNAQHKDDKQRCLNEFCALGCVCPSLSNGYPLQQHCGKPKCMLQCNCKGPTPSNIIRVETDGRSITTEDAYNMRRQATARLARIEKEFTSTVVVTENETLLINETQYEKKRRCTKVPKRYQDYRDTDNDFGRISPIKSCSTPLMDTNDSRISPATTISEVMSDLPEPIYVKPTILRQLKHCSVPLVLFKQTQNMAVWCMIHQMYKCFCGGQALEGKRMQIEREESKIDSHDSVGNGKKAYSSKAFYSFESAEELSSSSPKPHRYSEEIKISEIKQESTLEDLKSPKPTNEQFGCSRHVPVQSLKYRSINRKRRGEILDSIESTEDKESQLLLNEHIMRSVYFHKEKQNEEKKFPEPKIIPDEEAVDVKPNLQALEIKNKVEEQIIKSAQMEYLELPYSKPIAGVPIKLKRSHISSDDTQPVEKKQKQTKPSNRKEPIVEKEKEEAVKEQSIVFEEVNLPRTSNCYSLNSRSGDITENTNDMNKFIGAELSATEGSNFSAGSEGVRESYNDVIKMLNSLVSRKMHDIGNALKRDSKIVPPPSENILCVLQWKNFLGAFNEGLIHIWEVRMKMRTFLAATITSMIPMVPGALAVINIIQTDLKKLPLIARMLLQGNLADSRVNLAVIMQGRSHYWYVKGFLQPNVDSACLRPTPETHPELTQKINTLCSSLLKQRTKEAEQRDVLMKHKAKNLDLHTQNQQDPLSILPSTNMLGQQRSEDNCNLKKQTSKSNVQTLQQPTSNMPHANGVTEIEEMPAFESIKFSQSLRASNIEIRKAIPSDILDIQTPETFETDHSWYVLDLCNDFSHIFVPLQREIVSLDRLQKLAALSVERQKVIRIQFLKSACFNAFILPSSKRKVLFGPFALNAEPPILVLLQSVDGKMMTRETYQRLHKILPKFKRTNAFWLRQVNGKISFDDINKKSETQMNAMVKKEKPNSQVSLDNDCENDCIIVEETSNLPNTIKKSRSQITSESLLQGTHVDNSSMQPLSSLTELKSDSFVELGLLGSKAICDQPSLSSEKFTNFVIQTSNKTKKIEILSPPHKAKKARLDSMYQQNQQHTSTNIVKQTPHSNLDVNPATDDATVNKLQKYPSGATTVLKPKLSAKLTNISHAITSKANTTVPMTKKGMKLLNIPKLQKLRSKMESNSFTPQINDRLNHIVVITNRQRNAQTPGGSSSLNEPRFMNAKEVPSKISTINNPTTIMGNSSYLTSAQAATTVVSPKGKLNGLWKHNVPSLEPVIMPKLTQMTKATTENSTLITQNKPIHRMSSGIMRLPESAFMQKRSPNSEQTAKKMPTTTNLFGATATQPMGVDYKRRAQKQVLHMKASVGVTGTQNNTYRLAATPGNATTIPTQQRVVHTSKNNNIESNGVQVKRVRYTIHTNGATSSGLGNPSQSSTTASGSGGVSLPNVKTFNIDQGKGNSTAIFPTTTTTTTIEGSSNDDPLRTPPVYGYFSSNLPRLPKFLAKRNNLDFFIKVPDIGVIKADGIRNVNAFLNQHILKTFPQISEKMIWTFCPNKNNNSIGNVGNNAQKTSMAQAKMNASMSGAKTTIRPNVPNFFKSALQSQRTIGETFAIND